MPGFTSSIVSYPERGPDGISRYRGNTTGYIIEDFLRLVHKKPNGIFCDPMVGGGTSRDVTARLSAHASIDEPALRNLSENFREFDLREGFDASRDDLLTALGNTPAHSVFLHPPYAQMIPYSGPGGMWGATVNDADLSATADVDEFVFAMQAVLQNVYQALEPGGHYGLLLGSWRTKGRYYHLPAMMLPLCPGELQAEIIKEQHNCTSDRRLYASGRQPSWVPIRHETFFVFRRAADATSIYIGLDTLERLERYASMTWANLLHSAFRSGEVKTLKELYATFRYHPKTRTNPNYEAKIRQTLQLDERFRRIVRGRWGLAA